MDSALEKRGADVVAKGLPVSTARKNASEVHSTNQIHTSWGGIPEAGSFMLPP